MLRFAAAALLGTSIVAQTAADHQTVIARLAREADAFERYAYRVTATETLRQTVPAGVRYARGPRGVLTSLPERTTEIVSQYGFISLDEPGGSLKEVRSVLKIDGLVWNKRPESLGQLARDLSARDEKAKRKSLEKFEDYGLYGFISDLGQLVLLFSRGGTAKYEIAFDKVEESGYWVYNYSQLDGKEAFTVYGEGPEATRQKIKGRIWVNPADKLPFRISIDVERMVQNVALRDISTVDYAMSPFGCLLPARIVHQQFGGRMLYVTDVFEYRDYRETLPGSKR